MATSLVSTGVTFPNGSVQASAAKILHIEMGSTSTMFTTTAASPVPIGLSKTITPKFSSSQIMINCNIGGIFLNGANSFVSLQLLRNGTQVYQFAYPQGYLGTDLYRGFSTSSTIVDTPGTTSALTYSVTAVVHGSGTADFQRDNAVTSTIMLMEVGA